MKNLPIFIALALLAFGCTEIEYREIEKEVLKRDTVTKFVDRYYAGLDTVEIEVLVPTPTRAESDTVFITQVDTIWIQRIDTLWITKTETKTVYDTIWERHYGDTLVLWTGGSYKMIPEELQPMSWWFFDEANSRKLNPPGGLLVMTVKDLGAVQQAYSHDVDNFHIIVLNSRQTWDEMFLPLMRELAIWQLGKDFSYDPTSVFYPLYPTNQIRWSNRSQYPAQVNQFFQ